MKKLFHSISSLKYSNFNCKSTNYVSCTLSLIAEWTNFLKTVRELKDSSVVDLSTSSRISVKQFYKETSSGRNYFFFFYLNFDIFKQFLLYSFLFFLQHPMRPANKPYTNYRHLSSRIKPKQKKVCNCSIKFCYSNQACADVWEN